MISRAAPTNTMPPPLRRSSPPLRARSRKLPTSPMNRMPASTPIICTLSRMSPLRTWLNSCVTTVRVTYSPGDGVKNPRAPTYRASGTTRLTARTTPTTASANSTTRSEVLRRARVWCSKNVTATTSAEGDARRLALLGALGRLQLLRLREGEDVGDEVRRERLAADVVLHDGVVVALAGERDAVLGARQLFLDRQHVLVRLELRVGLDHREEPAERARQPRLRLREPAHRLGAARGAGRALRGLHGARARRDDGIERLALVRHVTLGRLHQVGNEVVAALALDVGLRERGAG